MKVLVMITILMKRCDINLPQQLIYNTKWITISAFNHVINLL